MAITNLKVSNFKSFKDLDLNLGRFNVVCRCERIRQVEFHADIQVRSRHSD